MDYRLLTATPKKAVVNAYAALGLSMEDSYDCWLQDQSEREKAHHSKFEYSLGEFRISGEEIYARLEDFYIKYEWSAPGAEITE